MHTQSPERCTPTLRRSLSRPVLAASLIAGLLGHAWAQPHPVTPAQKATAQQVAQQGVPLSALSPTAPEQYVVQRGDTLWDISRLFLMQPWRWPELWGMNLQDIRNPHLIYPSQTLYLVRGADGRARLSLSRNRGTPETVRLSPRARTESMSDLALPTVQPHLIEPFLIEAVIVDEQTLAQAPRIIGTTDSRVLMSTGDRAYARSSSTEMLERIARGPRSYRIFREARPIVDPDTKEVLGHEAQFLGRAELVRGEGSTERLDAQGQAVEQYAPATLDIMAARGEIRAGDRILPLAERTFLNFVPHLPPAEIQAKVASIYGESALTFAGQNQVIAINRGTDDGIEVGHVLQMLSTGERIVDNDGKSRAAIQLPDETNGTALVFRTFERVSYALLLQVSRPVKVGDSLVPPR